MMDDQANMEWAYRFFVTTCGAVIAYFTKRVVDDVRQLRSESGQCKIDLAEFRAEVAREYARDVNVQASLNRIHERLDRLPAEISNALEKRK